MFGTIENTHGKIIDKLSSIKKAIRSVRDFGAKLRELSLQKPGKKYTVIRKNLDGICANLLMDRAKSLEADYNLSIASILSQYYDDNTTISEEKLTRDYYRTVTSENHLAQIDQIIAQVSEAVEVLLGALRSNLASKAESREIEYQIQGILAELERARALEINIALEKRNYEVCKCGQRMTVVPELSELRCPNPVCGKIKAIIGAVFRDIQFYPQDGQKSRHSGYDTTRHYHFWMQRLQALESKTFDKKDLDRIEYVLDRDCYDRKSLNCEQMRAILKDPRVSATHLNDHVPLLIKTFGGRSPPQLDYQEYRLLSIRFNKVMRLYESVNPGGGNKPYYPYFIYKILEHMFRDNPEKLRILNYIHLQSRDTVIKNDKFYEQLCAISDPADGLVYRATDPAGRI